MWRLGVLLAVSFAFVAADVKRELCFNKSTPRNELRYNLFFLSAYKFRSLFSFDYLLYDLNSSLFYGQDGIWNL